MFGRPVVRSVARSTRQYSTHTTKETEINVPKVLGVAAVLGGLIYVYNNTQSSAPLIKTTHYRDFEARRANNRDNIRLDIDEKANAHNFIFNPGWLISESKEFRPNRNYNLIPRHSPWGPQAGQGIKTDNLGARKERPVMFAPAKN